MSPSVPRRAVQGLRHTGILEDSLWKNRIMSASHASVIATFSRRMRLQLENGDEVDARIKGKTIKPVCGDRVTAKTIENEDDWLITTILDRRNALTRPNLRGHAEVLAANIDTLVVVAAIAPTPDWFVVDRYLSAAENMGAQAIVVLNKTDLGAADETLLSVLQDYEELGYPVLLTSAESGENLEQLEAQIGNRVAIIVGQSGVGKSSLINRMIDRAALPTAAISAKRDEGRHTTVNSIMLRLSGGGSVIDSPGVRDYAPALADAAAVGLGFREIERLRADCKFANCRHTREPGCAVKHAVDDGRMSTRRYESYKRLLNLTSRLTPNR